jgi:hypothetical protein
MAAEIASNSEQSGIGLGGGDQQFAQHGRMRRLLHQLRTSYISSEVNEPSI